MPPTITRRIDRGELPLGTDAQTLLDVFRAIVDVRSLSPRLDRAWLTLAIRTVPVGA